MTAPNSPPTGRKVLTPRRLTLLASVAGIGAAVLLAGPGGYLPMSFAAAAQPTPAADTTGPQTVQHPQGFADLVAKVKPAVISVRVKLDEANAEAGLTSNQNDQQTIPLVPGSPMEKFFQQFGFGDGDMGPQARPHHQLITGEGSGFFISPDGYAVTNDHVVDHAKSVQVTTDDGTIYDAKVVGTDRKTDLALIKVEAKDKQFAYVKFANQTPRVGDWVVAVGNPFGLGGTVTAGIVSAHGRDIGGNSYGDYLQIDAPINRGNSGGPAFNMNGDVVGVNTAIYSPSGGSVGIGFDIPADTAKVIVAQLKEKGFVAHGFLGVQVQPVTAGIADSLGMKAAEGAMVDEMQPNSPAAKAGLETGDVITAVNGTKIKDARDLSRTVGMMAPDASVKLEIMRKGEAKTLEATLGKLPGERQAKAESNETAPNKDVPHLGLTVAPASDVEGAGQKGVVVTNVDPDGPAAQQGIETGNVILDVGGKAVANVGDVCKALADAKSQGKHDVLMRIKSDRATLFVAVPFANG
jgi:serine protease Do